MLRSPGHLRRAATTPSASPQDYAPRAVSWSNLPPHTCTTGVCTCRLWQDARAEKASPGHAGLNTLVGEGGARQCMRTSMRGASLRLVCSGRRMSANAGRHVNRSNKRPAHATSRQPPWPRPERIGAVGSLPTANPCFSALCLATDANEPQMSYTFAVGVPDCWNRSLCGEWAYSHATLANTSRVNPIINIEDFPGVDNESRSVYQPID
jgi:hypothetical protein